MSIIMNVLYLAFALGIIIIVHELGHLIVAKRNGVHCHEFSIGMGPLVKKIYKDKSGTQYSIRAVPLGGYVMMAGENDEKSEANNISYDQMLSNKSAWVKIKVLSAGSFMNIVLTIFIMFVIGFFNGSPYNSMQITVANDSPFAQAGIKTGDTILGVNGQEIDGYNELLDVLSKNPTDISVEILDENDIEKTVDVKKEEASLYGVSAYFADKYNPLSAIKYAFLSTYSLFDTIVQSFVMLATQQAGVKDLTGIIGIYSMGSSVIKNGFISGLEFVAYLSINIGLVNLLPIPALDGGRLVFAFYELIFRRKANKKLENGITYFGVFLMLFLFVYITYNDISRIFS